MPFLHLMVYALDSRLSGTAVVASPLILFLVFMFYWLLFQCPVAIQQYKCTAYCMCQADQIKTYEVQPDLMDNIQL